MLTNRLLCCFSHFCYSIINVLTSPFYRSIYVNHYTNVFHYNNIESFQLTAFVRSDNLQLGTPFILVFKTSARWLGNVKLLYWPIDGGERSPSRENGSDIWNTRNCYFHRKMAIFSVEMVKGIHYYL